LGYFNMSVSEQQRLFNQYPVKEAFKPDVWHRASKDEKRIEANALVEDFLRGGGQITKVPEKKRRKGGNPDQIFQTDTRAPKVHEHWSRKFFAGDDFTAKGPRFTSKPVSEKAIDKADIEHKAGVAHEEFTGAVIEIAGKLQPAHVDHAIDEAVVDLVSKGGSEKVVKLVADTKDALSDADRRAKIRDELNLNDVDYTHNARLKLAA
jgi:hypothetical protein